MGISRDLQIAVKISRSDLGILQKSVAELNATDKALCEPLRLRDSTLYANASDLFDVLTYGTQAFSRMTFGRLKRAANDAISVAEQDSKSEHVRQNLKSARELIARVRFIKGDV